MPPLATIPRRPFPILSLGIVCALYVGGATRAGAGLIVNTNLLAGAAPGNSAGSGTLQSVFEAAAQVWSNIFSGNGFTHTLTLNYGWGAQSGTTLAAHSLTGEGGSPHRETSGQIIFDNDGTSVFFLDGSLDPFHPLTAGNTEYGALVTSSANFGGGSMNTSRRFGSATGNASGRTDLFSVALHEIGHALGMSSANDAYQAESWPDNDIDLTGSFAYAGSALPTNNGGVPATLATSNSHLNIADALLFPSISAGIRRLPSEADILANAQLSLFTNPILNLDFSAVPEPGSFALSIIIVGPWFVVRRRRRSRSVAA